MKFPNKPKTSIGTFLLILAFLLGREIKKSLEVAFLDTTKSKRRKPALAAPPGGRRTSSHKRIMHGATTVSSRGETDEEEQQAGMVEGEDSGGRPSKL